MLKKFILLAALLPGLALADTPVIWSGTTAKWLPAGLKSAGVCKLSESGVMTSGTVSDSNLASSYLYADGTRALSGAWNAGQNITAPAFIGALTGNASTATALASNPTDCGAGTKATSIDASGNLTCSAVSLTADVSGTLPVTNGGTGTSTQFTVGSAIFAGASGVYAEDNANFFWDDSNNRLGIGTASPGYKLDIAASGTNETVLSLDPSSAGGSDVDFRFEGASNAIFRVDRGVGSLFVFSGGYLNVGGTRTPLNQLEVQVASTNTTPASGLTQNVANLPLFAAVNNTSTANNWSAYCYAGASTGSTGLDACMVATHTDHTNGSEDADWSVWLATNGTKNNRLNLTNAGVLTLSGYGAGVLQADSSGVISSSAVDLATSDVTGTLPVANGGTGQTSYTDGQLLIGNSSGNTLTKSTLTAGSNISITNGGGSITIASTVSASSLAITTSAYAVLSGGDSSFNVTTGNYYCQDFTTTGSLVVTSPGLVKFLLVGGGGGGSWSGGGGGGVIDHYYFDTWVSTGSYPVQVGQQGQGGRADTTRGSNGQDTTFLGYEAKGGGGGGSTADGQCTGGTGGAGGGGGMGSSANACTVGSGTYNKPEVQGFSGGAKVLSTCHTSAGGGGAAAVGASGSSCQGGAGGEGQSSMITGSRTWWGGGGGGGVANSGGICTGLNGPGGTGGGGAGSTVGSAGTANTGGGGGGSCSVTSQIGADGGKGRAIICGQKPQ